MGWWVYERTEVGGASDMIGDNTVVRDITKKDVEGILDNKGKCFVEVDCKNKLSVPKNGTGGRKIVIHLKKHAPR